MVNCPNKTVAPKPAIGTLMLFLVVGCANQSSSLRPMNYGFYLAPMEVEHLRTAARFGDGSAAYKLWEYFALWRFDEKRSLYWLRRSAENGNIGSEVNLGHELMRDPAKGRRGEAAFWLVKAEKQAGRHTEWQNYNYGYIQCLLGDLYLKGKAVAKDVPQAVAWFEKAALNSDTNALVSLALIYAGQSRGAFRLGITNGPVSLAEEYEIAGDRCSNVVSAYAWGSVALRKIPEPSITGQELKRGLDALAAVMTTEELGSARKRGLEICSNILAKERERRPARSSGDDP